MSVRVSEKLRAVEEAVKGVIREWLRGDVNITLLNIDNLRSEISDRLYDLGIYEEPVIELDTVFDMNVGGSPQVKLWIYLPRHRISCLALTTASAIYLTATKANIASTIRVDKDALVMCSER